MRYFSDTQHFFLVGRTVGIQPLEKKRASSAEILAIPFFFTKQANFDNCFFFNPHTIFHESCIAKAQQTNDGRTPLLQPVIHWL